MTKEQQALKRLKNDNNIVILPVDKGRVTGVMDKTDYFDKIDALVNDKQTYEELKRDPTPALLRKLNSKIPALKKTDAIDANNHIAVHHQRTNHNNDLDSAQCFTYSTNYFQRLTLESWYTNLEQTPL